MTAQNNITFSQPTKIVKSKNIDVSLKCSLLEKHESFNQNANVYWYFKKTCKVSCWNQPEEDKWNEIKCQHGPCKMTLELDESADNGFYMCKIFPYRTSNFTVLQIEVTKTFQLDLFGRI